MPIGRERFETYWPRYLRHAKGEMTHGSWEDVRAHGAKRLLPVLQRLQMARIGVTAVRDWRAQMLEAVEAGEWAPKTINNARIALLGCLRMAVEDGLMTHNPVLDVRPLAIEFTERPYLRLAQINDYLDSCAPHYRPLAALLVGTGARISEAIALRIDDVDLGAGTVSIHKQRVRGTSLGHPPDQGPQLPHRRHRPRLGGHAARPARCPRRARQRRCRLAVPLPARLARTPRPPDRPAPPHRNTVHDWHEQALEDAGLAKLPLHGLRHTAAAAWLGTGRSLEFVRAQLGPQLDQGDQRLLRAPRGALPRRGRRRYGGTHPRHPRPRRVALRHASQRGGAGVPGPPRRT